MYPIRQERRRKRNHRSQLLFKRMSQPFSAITRLPLSRAFPETTLQDRSGSHVPGTHRWLHTQGGESRSRSGGSGQTPGSQSQHSYYTKPVSEVRCSSILNLAVAFPHHFIRHEELATARGIDPNKYTKGLDCHEMAVCGPGEDTVTMAAEAGRRLLQQSPEQTQNIGLCIVATESAVDGSKPISIYIHELLGLPSSCRVFEVKHACYGGTAAIQMAATWTQANPHKQALVITTDIARYAIHSAGEPTQGAGAIAMLVGQATSQEAVLQLSPVSGIHAQQVYDFWRPTYQSWAEVKGKYSVQCYLEGLKAAYQDYHKQVEHEPHPDYLLFHVPFPKMARKGHACLAELTGISGDVELINDFEARVDHSLWANRRVGNIYTGSLYLSLAALCERQDQSREGLRVGIFSYGSGSCSEYFTGTLGQGHYTPHIQQLLEQRREVDTATYERLLTHAAQLETNDSYDPDLPTHNQPFSFLGIRNHERIYRKNRL